LKIDAARFSVVLRSVLNADTEARLPCLTHEPVHGEVEACNYPIALFLPSYVDGVVDGTIRNPRDTFNYDRLALYSTNSGTAIGMSRTEAIIHGLLESIERDTISRFLVRAFLLQDASSLRRVEVESLPGDLRRLRENIQIEVSAEIQIYQIFGRFNVPVFCTWIDRNEDVFHPHGFGSSLCSIHAIRRSLHEAAQAYFSVNVLHDRNAIIKNNRRALRLLESLPFHHRCAVFDMGALSQELAMASLRQVPSSSGWAASQTETYLRAITSRIEAAGQTAFNASIVEEPGVGLAVTHSFTSQQDHFFTVLNGLPSLPSSLDAKVCS
jgi:ribosomal protein S12 methylthiotransferase accessory factor